MEQPIGKTRGLLRRYAFDGSQAAFASLVEQHMKLVYTTCYRELRQRELAEEAAQAVFLLLAKKARGMRSECGLATWLYTTARFEASNLRKQEKRRMIREQQAFYQAQGRYERSIDEAWSSIEPALNDAISALAAKDQEAILLRFFEEMSLREVGLAMGTNEEAARKRVNRALSKLRSALVNRKAAAVSVAALAALLSARATYAAPAHLTVSVTQSAGAIASPSLAPPASGGVAASRGGFLFRPLNSLLAKGLIIVSTTKIVAGATAAVVVLLCLTFAVVKVRTDDPLVGTTWTCTIAGTLPDGKVASHPMAFHILDKRSPGYYDDAIDDLFWHSYGVKGYTTLNGKNISFVVPGGAGYSLSGTLSGNTVLGKYNQVYKGQMLDWPITMTKSR